MAGRMIVSLVAGPACGSDKPYRGLNQSELKTNSGYVAIESPEEPTRGEGSTEIKR